MNKTILASVLLTFACAASAQSPPPAAPAPRTGSGHAEAKDSERFCIRETGSRIVATRNAQSEREQQDCVAAGGRVFTRDEIDSTGSTEIGEALRQLDPAVQVNTSNSPQSTSTP